MPRKIFLSVSITALFVLGGLSLSRFVSAQTSTPAPTNVKVMGASACALDISFDSPVDGYKYGFEISPDPSFPAATKWGEDFLTDANGNYVSGTTGQTLTITPPPNSTTYGYGVPPQTIFFTPGTKYYFHVRVYPQNGNKESNWSALVSGDTNAMPAPVPPTNVTGTWNDATGRIELTWNAGSQPSNFSSYGGFDVYRAVSTNGGSTYSNFTKVGSQAAGQTFYYDVSIDPANSYEYYVQAYDTDAGCVSSGIAAPQIAYSSNSSPTVVIPVAPTSLKVDSAIYTTGPEIDISWKDNAKNEDTYEVYRSFRNNTSYGNSPVKTVGANTKTFQDTDPTLQKGELYYYKVRACKSSGAWCSGFSNEISQRAPSDMIVLTTNATSFSGATNTAYVNHAWSPANLTTDTVTSFVRTDGNGTAVDITSSCSFTSDGAGGETCVESGVPLGATYTYTVTVKRRKSITTYDTLTANSNLNLVGVQPFTGHGWNIDGSTATSGIGWVSFSSDADAPTSPHKYNVWVDQGGTIRGAAWANVTDGNGSVYGWVSFEPNDLSGCPGGSGCSAHMAADGSVSGWARFIAAKGSSTGWDGWISLRAGTKDPIQYGTCFGHSDGATATVGGAQYYIGATCKHDGTASFSKWTGLAWAGPLGWIMWNPNDNKILPPPGILIQPAGPFTLAYREEKVFSADRNAKWFVQGPTGSAVPGGNNSLGHVAPLNTLVNATTTYTAPDGNLSGGKVIASSTESAGTVTDSVGMNVREPYGLSCNTVVGTGTSINLRWNANYTDPNYTTYAAHTLSLKEVTGGANTFVCTSQTNTPGSGSCTIDNLAALSTHTYELDARYVKDGKSFAMPQATCTVGSVSAATTDTPSDTTVLGHDDGTIYVNWKDNTTTTLPYHFELQRIRVTPNPSTGPEIKGATPTLVTLGWLNDTSSTPYRNYYERSTNTDPSQRFVQNTDTSLFSANVDGSSDPTVTTALPYTINDAVSEATTYFYRLRACSSINNGDIEPFYTQKTNAKNPTAVATPALVCSGYTDSIGGGTPIATTTPPFAPTNLSAAPKSGTQVELSWTDNSNKESGFEVFANGASAGTVPAHAGTGSTSYMVSGLSPATSYDFTVKAYYDYALPSPGKVYSSSSNTVTASTGIAAGGKNEAASVAAQGGAARFLASIGEVASGVWKALIGPRHSGNVEQVSDLMDGLKRTFGTFFERTSGAVQQLGELSSRLAAITGNFIVKNTPVAQGNNLLDQYFQQFDKTTQTPIYKDTGLSSDTVYLYRVRAVYDDGSGRVTPWDNLGAAKTLRNNGGGPTGAASPICTRNSYCDFSIQGVQSTTDANGNQESSLKQCAVNADCRNVGRSGQTYQER